jgi:hypothetical protein
VVLCAGSSRLFSLLPAKCFGCSHLFCLFTRLCCRYCDCDHVDAAVQPLHGDAIRVRLSVRVVLHRRDHGSPGRWLSCVCMCAHAYVLCSPVLFFVLRLISPHSNTTLSQHTHVKSRPLAILLCSSCLLFSWLSLASVKLLTFFLPTSLLLLLVSIGFSLWA